MLPGLDKKETMEQDSYKEQACSVYEKAPSIKQQRKETQLERAGLRVWATVARRKLNFDSANMQGNAYVQF